MSDRGRADEGQGLVEFALVLPVLVILLVGIFDVARAVQISATLNTAVREGTRYAVVHGALSASPSGPGSATYTPPDRDTAVEAAVIERTAGVPGPVTVRASWPDGTNARGARVVVSASYDLVPVLSAAFIGDRLRMTLSASSSLVIDH